MVSSLPQFHPHKLGGTAAHKLYAGSIYCMDLCTYSRYLFVTSTPTSSALD